METEEPASRWEPVASRHADALRAGSRRGSATGGAFEDDEIDLDALEAHRAGDLMDLLREVAQGAAAPEGAGAPSRRIAAPAEAATGASPSP